MDPGLVRRSPRRRTERGAPSRTDSDALAAVRRHLWASCANRNSPAPPVAPLLANPPAQILSFLVDAAYYAARKGQSRVKIEREPQSLGEGWSPPFATIPAQAGGAGAASRAWRGCPERDRARGSRTPTASSGGRLRARGGSRWSRRSGRIRAPVVG